MRDKALKNECETLYVDELLSPPEVVQATGVSLPTFYRWRTEGDWGRKREETMGLRDKLARLANKLLDQALEDGKDQGKTVDAQQVYGLVKILGGIYRTGEVKEKVVMVDDAEKLLEAMKEVKELKPLLENPLVLAELEGKLKEKMK